MPKGTPTPKRIAALQDIVAIAQEHDHPTVEVWTHELARLIQVAVTANAHVSSRPNERRTLLALADVVRALDEGDTHADTD